MRSNSVSRGRRIAACIAIAALAAVPAVTAGGTAVATPPAISLSLAWQHPLTSGHPVWFGSPGVADLDGQGVSLLVGDRGGRIWAFHASDGTSVAGWPYRTTKSVMSTPSVLGSGTSALVFVGLGESPTPRVGGYLALKATGQKAWFRQPYLLPGNRGGTRGVMSSMSVGNIRTGTDVIGGAMGQMQWAMDAETGKTLKGFPWLQADTNFTTPALADIYGTGRDYIIEGGDSSRGVAYYQTYKNGGHIRILRPSGNSMKRSPNDGLVCQYNTNQVVQSSPAVGPFLAGGAIGIVAGTGSFFNHATSDTRRLIVINTACKLVWSAVLDGSTAPSPALADVNGDGTLDVVTNTGRGTVYAFNGTDGSPLWTQYLASSTDGSVTTFQSPTGDFQYVLAPTSNGLAIIDGRDGTVVQTIGTGIRLKNSAAVTADPDGSIGITIAGAQGSNGVIQHYTVLGSSVATVQTPGAWPMFHHDPQLTGYAH